jgi:hypothetical protein
MNPLIYRKKTARLLVLTMLIFSMVARGQDSLSFSFDGVTYKYPVTISNDTLAVDYWNYLSAHPHSGIFTVSHEPWNGQYNCHAFALPNDTAVWAETSDGNPDDAPEIYYNSGYYVTATSVSQAEIAVYGSQTSPTHTALRLTTSTSTFAKEFLARYPQYAGWWISKWDGGPLVIHQLDSCPFYSASQPPHLYRKEPDGGTTNNISTANFVIKGDFTGPILVCPFTGNQFSLGYKDALDNDTTWISTPVSFTVNWSCSSNITLSPSTSSYPITATDNGTGGNAGYIQATLYFPDGTSDTVTRYSAWVGPPAAITSISTSQWTAGGSGEEVLTVSSGSNEFYGWPFNSADVVPPSACCLDSHGATSYSWTCLSEGGPSITFNQNPDLIGYRYADGSFTPTGVYGTLYIHASNACGTTSAFQSIYVSSGEDYTYTLSPNPASDHVTVNISPISTQTAAANTAAAPSSGVVSPPAVTYTVKVVDLSGTLFYVSSQSVASARAMSMFTVPTSKLKAGNYTVIVTDGKTTSGKNLLVVH